MLGSSKNFRLGTLDIAPSRNAVIAGDQNIHLEPKVMDVLCLLAQNNEGVVLREDLINQVWSVESGADESLTRAISLLRKTLKQCGNSSTIETIPKRGYRLVTGKTDPSLSDFTLPDKLAYADVMVDQPPAYSIAVLRFDDLSPKQDHGYLANGITEEVLNALVRVADLKVTARTSSFALHGKTTNIREIGQALNVAYLIEGSVRLRDSKIRATAQLINATDGTHLWSKTFDAALDDVFELEDRLSIGIMDATVAALDIAKAAPSVSKRTRNVQAYPLFVQGRTLTLQVNGQLTLPTAIKLFEQVVDLDPEFAEGWAWLALAHHNLPEYSATVNWAEHVSEHKRASERAMQLDPDSSYSIKAHAGVKCVELKFHEALAAYKNAYDRDPNNVDHILVYGYMLAGVGLNKQAHELFKIGMPLDPLSGPWYANFGTIEIALNNFEAAEKNFKQSLRLGYGPAIILLGQLYTLMGEQKKALAFVKQKFNQLDPIFQAQLQSPIIRKVVYGSLFKRSKTARWLMSKVLQHRMRSPAWQPTVMSTLSMLFADRPRDFMHHILTKPNSFVAHTMSRIWDPSEEARNIRMHDDFPAFAEKIGLLRCWQENGWPSHFKPFEGTDGSNGQYTRS
ncbi:MAG: TolB-like protein/DNA-binding winged helix-turn-helix (wHTH) protein [Arenicella sp.]|jgi:TolB-like protein/DNA-binding winged helix-turn-helix (wHTH) protein